MLLDERDLLRGVHLSDRQEVALILRRHTDSERHSLDALAGVTTGERGGLTGLPLRIMCGR